ncbi:hypothetical protein MLOOGBEN_28825 [Bacillus sp. EB106-08-02-XG196]|uniref:hypothetical protein n=1 Tax=Bacillus sp. EB106-08-02-XG196 TaxID=2737049 RepID=UPI0015C43C9E|nr:hypothetical protein [Bacillus sp. EB106-08-02-XG196]NWQ44684.1 hypothetical protein [Bacillus sp. EB106-08-02-XG196]
MQPLSKAQVNQYMSYLTNDQQEYLLSAIKQSKKSKWLEVLAKKKGFDIQEGMTVEEIENLIDDWILVEILDSGYGNKNYRCICGTNLRYQYIVLNKKQQETYGLGKTCFKNHTNLPSDVVSDILNGFHKIDLERDEILYKVASKEYTDITPYQLINNIPKDILNQSKLGLPLTDKQLALLEGLKREHDSVLKLEKLFHSLHPDVRKFIVRFPNEIKEEIIEKLLFERDYLVDLPNDFHDEEIEQFVSLGLPLLDKHLERLHQYNRNVKQKVKELRRQEEEAYWRSMQYQNRERKINYIQTTDSTLNYETLINRHLTTLQKVREKEGQLSPRMKGDWNKVEHMVRECKKGKVFDYSSFKLNLNMICLSIKVERDIYL